MGRGKGQKSLALIKAVREILAEIHPATVRAVCYRLFTGGLIANMSKNETNRVGTQLTWARENNKIPWEWVLDETRDAENYRRGWANPEAFLRAASVSYRRDFWAYQPSHVEVWSEKGTVRGTLAPILEGYGVTFRVMHGYGSATAVHQVAELSEQDEKPWHVFYVGDWDPSGLHMSEVDLPTRLARYSANGDLDRQCAELGQTREQVLEAIALASLPKEVWEEVIAGKLAVTEALRQKRRKNIQPPHIKTLGNMRLTRVALTVEDVTYGELSPFDADTKRGDPRWGWYVGRYGQQCWELDALSPVILRNRVEAAIQAEIEPEAWERCRLGETAEQQSLKLVLEKVRRSISRQAWK